MQLKDVVKATFDFVQTPVVPYDIPICAEVQERLDEYYGSRTWHENMLPYIHAAMGGFVNEDIGDGKIRDKFGTVTEQGNVLHVVQPALPEPTLKGYKWPDPRTLDDWDRFAEEFERHEDSFRMFGLGFGMFERSWLMRGFENILVDLVKHPGFVEELLDRLLEFQLEVISVMTTTVPMDACFCGDDWCDQRGAIMGIPLWRKFFKPRIAKLIERCHEQGLPMIYHCCGNVLPLVDDLMEIGLDGLESVQPEAMNVFELKRKVAGRMVLIGGMGVQSTLPFATPDDVRSLTQELINELGKSGGYILAPAKPLMPDVPTENAVAFIETACLQAGAKVRT